jgi:hypothetical protein
MPSYNQKGFLLDVEDGKVSGWNHIHKFALSKVVDASYQDLWSAGGLYTYPTSGEACTINSSSAADVTTDSGAATVTVFGLNNDFEPIQEVVSLNGITNVDLANTYRRIYRMQVSSLGVSGAQDHGWNVGTIHVSGATSGTLGEIPIAQNQSQMSMYTIPANYTGFILRMHLTATKQDEVFVEMQTRDIDTGEPFQTKWSQYVTVNGVPTDMVYRVRQKHDIQFRIHETDTSDAISLHYLLMLRNDSVAADAAD